MNIVDRIIRENLGREHKIAMEEGNDRVKYGELFALVERWRAVLERAGMRRFDRVAFLCEDSVDYVCVSLALMAAGAVPAPLSPSLARHETGPALEDMDAAWLLYDETVQAPLTGSVLEGPSRKRRFRLAARVAKRDIDAAFAGCDPAFVRFSSGTTGASKGVVLSHGAVYERTEAANRVLRITSDDRILWVLSMSYHFVVTILLFLRRGARIILCGSDFPSGLCRQLAADAGTFIYASPVHYGLLAGGGFEADISPAVRMAVSTAMSLSPEVAARFERRFGLPLCQAYGVIEVGLPFIQRMDGARRPGSVGRLGDDYEIKFLEPDASGAGEILLRGKGMFSAYISPWRTREEIDPAGWFHTGDLGRLDKHGNMIILGRKREVINFAGMKIFPADVEEVLNSHPAVRESRVYGRPHAFYGQLPAANIVPACTPIDERELRRFCYARLAAHQVPKIFRQVKFIGKTASGKIRRA